MISYNFPMVAYDFPILWGDGADESGAGSETLTTCVDYLARVSLHLGSPKQLSHHLLGGNHPTYLGPDILAPVGNC